jgi:hypothetical protein
MQTIKFHQISNNSNYVVPEPEPSFNSIPDWYKNQPGLITPEFHLSMGNSGATIKKCMPIFDAMSAGYILKIPCDIYVDATNPERLSYTETKEMKDFLPELFQKHTPPQYSHYSVDLNVYHKELFRVNPYWAISTPKGTSIIYTHPIHRDELPFTSLTAIVDSDKFISRGAISMFIKKDFKGIIKQGTPFAQIIPFSRESWRMEISKFIDSEKDMDRQHMDLRSVFYNGYKNKYRSKKEFK